MAKPYKPVKLDPKTHIELMVLAAQLNLTASRTVQRLLDFRLAYSTEEPDITEETSRRTE
jgi:hypothetical protein